MTADVVTPTIVEELPMYGISRSGTPVKAKRVYLKGTKAAQDDWILLEAALGYADITGKILGLLGVVNDSSNNMVRETLTYTDSTDKLNLAGSTAGTAHIWVVVETE